ncbi:MAG: 30S ribosome-binding factor RbfA [Candidatus Sumerlaeia bacterium]
MLHSRMERVQKLIQQELGQILDRELRNPDIPRFITVAHVKVSPDLSEATVIVTFLSDEDDETIKHTLKELNRSAGYIRSLLAKRVRLKRHPHLRFVYTNATHHAADLEEIFHGIRREREEYLAAHPEERESETETGDSETPGGENPKE